MDKFLSVAMLPVVLTLGAYQVGLLCQKKLRSPLANPILIAVGLVILFLLVSGMEPKAPADFRFSIWVLETLGQAAENSSMEINRLPFLPSTISHAALSPRPDTATKGGRIFPSLIWKRIASDS